MRRLEALALLTLPLVGCRPAAPPPVAPPIPPLSEAPPTPADAQALLFQADDRLVLLTPDGTQHEEARGVGEQVAIAESAGIVAYLDDSGGVYRHELGSRPEKGRAFPSARDWALAISSGGNAIAYPFKHGGLEVRMTGKRDLDVEKPAHVSGLAWSPDDKLLAIGAMGGNDHEGQDGGLWLWQGGNAAERLVRPHPEWGCSRDPRWSPDGRWIAWTRGAGDGWAGDLVSADGTDLRREVLGAGPLGWTADSSGVLVSVHIEAGAFRTGYYDVAARKLTAFGEESEESVACLAPDGKRALVLARSGGKLIDLATLTETPWGAPTVPRAVAWSEDDRIAVLARGDTGLQTIRVFALSGELLEEITPTALVRSWLVWVALPPGG